MYKTSIDSIEVKEDSSLHEVKIYKKYQDVLPKIIELYNQELSFTDIGEQVGIHRDVVKRHLLRAGIDVDKELAERYQKKLEQVVELYEQRKSQLYIEQTLKLTRKTIRELLKSKDVKYKTKSEQWLIRWGNTDLREDAFETITSESAYWLGFLYTDGSISGEEVEGYSIELLIQRGDKAHIEKYRDFMRSTSKIEDIKPAGRLASRLRIGSKRIHDSLKALGFSNEKSYDAVPHESVKGNRDFWRGCIDGDGGVYCKGTINYKTHQLFLCGTLDTICEFIWFCQDKVGLVSRKYPVENYKKGYDKPLYSISYYGQEAVKIADFLYKDSTVYLDRKYQTYLEIRGPQGARLKFDDNPAHDIVIPDVSKFSGYPMIKQPDGSFLALEETENNIQEDYEYKVNLV